MFIKNLFLAKLKKRGMMQADAAQIMGINPATLSRKISGESDFTRNEIQLFKTALGLSASEVDAMFFA